MNIYPSIFMMHMDIVEFKKHTAHALRDYENLIEFYDVDCSGWKF